MTTLRILQISDLHVTPHMGDLMLGLDTEVFFRRTLDHAHSHHGPFDLMLLTGDLAQDPCADSYQRICKHLHDYPTPCLCLPGNHDDFDLMRQHLQQGKVSCDKQTVIGNWHIVLLNSQKVNSPVGALSDAELAFLRQALQSEPELPTLIAVHHHCIPSGSRWMDTMQIENSEAFLSLLQQHPQVKGVTFGHVHQVYEAKLADTVIVACPASCFQFTPYSQAFSIADTPPGYRVFELYEDGSLTSKVYRVPIDMGELDRSAHEY